jgi:hypothetical protein
MVSRAIVKRRWVSSFLQNDAFTWQFVRPNSVRVLQLSALLCGFSHGEVIHSFFAFGQKGFLL